jgi:predicted porin
MKKLLIATAALAMVAGTAQAQSSVQVYGILDMGYSDLSTKTTAGVTTDTVGINSAAGLSGSRLGFRGTEDLGGGLTAGFTYELGLTPENSTSAHTTRAALLSLSSKSMGSLSFGRGNTLGKNTNDTFSAYGGGASFEQGAVAFEVTRGKALANGTAVATNNAVDRASNQVTYTSPAFNGITVAAQLVSKSVDADNLAGETATSGTAFQLAYAGKGFTAAYTRTTHDVETQATSTTATAGTCYNTTSGLVTVIAAATNCAGGTARLTGVDSSTTSASKAETTVDQFGVTYTAGALKVFGLYNDAEYKATATTAVAENKGYDIGATYTMGKTTLLASFGDGEMRAASATTVTDVSGMQAQVRYALSKRTTAYGLYGKTEYKGASVGESDVTMIGLRHVF